MKSRPTSKSKNINRFIITGTIFLLAILSWRFFPTPGIFLTNSLIRPVVQGESFFHDLMSKAPAELTTSEQSELQVLREESASLNWLTDIEDGEKIVAGVIGRPTSLPYDVLLLDRGSDDGVLLNAPVFASENVAVGFVSAVYDQSALVALVSTPGYVSTVYIYGPNIYTTAVGLGGGVTRIHVPQGVPLAVGDTVVMPSLARGIYGSITTVDSVPERPEQYGYLTSEMPISSLRFVFIGQRPLSNISFEEAKSVVEETKREFLTVEVPEYILVDIESDVASTSTDIATSSLEREAGTSTTTEINDGGEE